MHFRYSFIHPIASVFILTHKHVRIWQKRVHNLNVNFKPSVQDRMLKAFLDVVILQMLEHQSMTAYRIDNFVLDKFHAKINPSVIYAKLATMERIDLIKCTPNNGKTYSLIEKGKKLLCNKALIIKEIHGCTITLFEGNRKNMK
jgi:DNA-binding PadR family transcriptional regulator